MAALPTSLIRYVLDPDNTIEDKLDLFLLRTDMVSKRGKHEAIRGFAHILTEAYVEMYTCQVTEEFERAAVIKRFIHSLKNLYRIAIHTYQDATLQEYRLLEVMDERLRTVDLSEAYCAV